MTEGINDREDYRPKSELQKGFLKSDFPLFSPSFIFYSSLAHFKNFVNLVRNIGEKRMIFWLI